MILRGPEESPIRLSQRSERRDAVRGDDPAYPMARTAADTSRFDVRPGLVGDPLRPETVKQPPRWPIEGRGDARPPVAEGDDSDPTLRIDRQEAGPAVGAAVMPSRPARRPTRGHRSHLPSESDTPDAEAAVAHGLPCQLHGFSEYSIGSIDTGIGESDHVGGC